jgi:hypothetical protein
MALNTFAHSSKNFWEGRRNYEEWQNALLRVLYKKGDQKEPTNYQGRVLQDAFACLLSAIIGGRLHQLIKKCGMEEQFAYQENTGTTTPHTVYVPLSNYVRNTNKTPTYCSLI